jgi:hypothetical protein
VRHFCIHLPAAIFNLAVFCIYLPAASFDLAAFLCPFASREFRSCGFFVSTC